MTKKKNFIFSWQSNQNMKRILNLIVGASFVLGAQVVKSADGDMMSSSEMKMGMMDFPTVYEGTGVVRSVKFTGQAQAQYTYVDNTIENAIVAETFTSGDESAVIASGKIAKDELAYTFKDAENTEAIEGFRRLRFGVEAQLFDSVMIKAVVNANESRDTFKSEYVDFDVAYATYEGAGFELMAGRVRQGFSAEGRMVSDELMTVERSPIARLVYNSARPTAIRISTPSMMGMMMENLSGSFTIASTDAATVWNSFDEELAFIGNFTFNGMSMPVNIDLFYSTEDKREGVFGYEYAASVDTTVKTGSVSTLLNVIYGEEAKGNFFGLVVMPYFNLMENVKAVFRFSYANADENLFDTVVNQSGLRTIDNGDILLGVDAPRPSNSPATQVFEYGNDLGDIYTVYAGVCFKMASNSSFVAGVEYFSLDGDREEDGYSLQAVYRYSF